VVLEVVLELVLVVFILSLKMQYSTKACMHAWLLCFSYVIILVLVFLLRNVLLMFIVETFYLVFMVYF